MLKGSKGDWSEVYAFLKLLLYGELSRADADLLPISGQTFEVAEIVREGVRFVREETEIALFRGSVRIGSCSYEHIRFYLDLFWQELINGVGKTFECPTGDRALSYLAQTSLKASNDSKADIQVKMVDKTTQALQSLSFSIKSYVGNASTLFNGSHATKFIFEVTGLEETDLATLNSIYTDPEAVKAFLVENAPRIELSFFDMMDDCCRKNFGLIDTYFPFIFADAIKYHYLGKSNKFDEICNFLSSEDPLHIDNPAFYEKKFKDFLVAVALGMEPKTPWNGDEQANGGYIVVKRNGDIVCYNIIERDSFKAYLFKHCKLDTPSGTKFLNQGEEYPDGTIYKNDGRYLINLNRQVRFC